MSAFNFVLLLLIAVMTSANGGVIKPHQLYDINDPTYSDHLVEVEYVDGHSIEAFWHPTIKGQPSLRLVVSHHDSDEIRVCNGTSMRRSRTKPELGELVGCRMEVFHYGSDVIVELLPTTETCHFDDLSDDCPIDMGYFDKQHFYDLFNMRVLLEKPPLVRYLGSNSHLHEFKFELDDGGIPGLSQVYEFEQMVYKLEQFYTDGKKFRRWMTVYEGEESSVKVLVDPAEEGEAKFRGLVRAKQRGEYDDGKTFWSLPSQEVAIEQRPAQDEQAVNVPTSQSNATTKYNDRIRLVQFVNEQFLDVYWLPSKAGEPSLRLLARNVDHMMDVEVCLATQMQRGLVKCRLFVDEGSVHELELVPTIGCRSSELSDRCQLDLGHREEPVEVATWDVPAIYEDEYALDERHDHTSFETPSAGRGRTDQTSPENPSNRQTDETSPEPTPSGQTNQTSPQTPPRLRSTGRDRVIVTVIFSITIIFFVLLFVLCCIPRELLVRCLTKRPARTSGFNLTSADDF